MDKEKILGDVPIPRGTRRNMAEAAFALFVQWVIADFIKGVSFDTTSSNTGSELGM
jgi:hypothetical protein